MTAVPQPDAFPPTPPEKSPADQESLRKSVEYCRDLTRAAARNFHYGLKLLPEPKRQSMFALYAYMRLVDDIADDDGAQRSMAMRRGDLDQWEAQTRQAIAAADGYAPPPRGHILWPAFIEMIRLHRIPAKIFQDMIAGQRQDLEGPVIRNFADLREYCYRVASVVGVASLYVFGFDGGERAIALAVDRGIAFQLTNILRDWKEDAARGRCYVPAEELAEAGVKPEAIAAGKDSPEFQKLMRFQIDRARLFYKQSAALDRLVHADARPTLEAMTRIYSGVLDKIAARPAAVLHGRVSLSKWSKMRIAWRALRSR